MEALAAYLHFVAMLLTGACLLAEAWILDPDIQPPQVRLLARIDLYYLLAAVAALATGLLRLAVSAKGAGFFLSNPVLYIKLALFVAVGLTSIVPTLRILRWNRALRDGRFQVMRGSEIAATRQLILVEVALFAGIPLAAVLMARGIGHA